LGHPNLQQAQRGAKQEHVLSAIIGTFAKSDKPPASNPNCSSSGKITSSPAAGGAASKGPMIEKRKRAQRSRFSGSIVELKKVSQCGSADGAITRSEGYKASIRLTISIFCG
jgi:hypothetical protein